MPWRIELKLKDGNSIRCEPTDGDELTISQNDLIRCRVADETINAKITDIKSTAVSHEIGQTFFIIEAAEQ